MEYALTRPTVGNLSRSQRQRASGSSSSVGLAVTPRRSTPEIISLKNSSVHRRRARMSVPNSTMVIMFTVLGCNGETNFT